MLTLRQLQILVALADTGRYHEAGVKLGLAQSGVTAQIKALEARLGLVLFDRGRHGARPTPAGETVIGRARAILADVDALTRLAQADAAQLGGVIRLGVLPTIGPYLLPMATPRLHQRYPQLRLLVREGHGLELEGWVQSGACDAALCTQVQAAAGIEAQLLFSERLYLAMADDDPLVGLDEIDPELLGGRDLLTLGDAFQIGRISAGLAERHGARLRTDYTGSSLDALRQMVAMGVGLALLPELYVLSEIEGREDVRVRPLKTARTHRAVYLIWRSGSARAGDYRELGEGLREAASQAMSAPRVWR
jgi:LysR family hydrogen peroxide-inducible transcriptional activator